MKFESVHTLGVINRTPNSFSCHGKSLETNAFFSKLNLHQQSNKIISDIGFESTAPMNQAISADEEMRRFEEFLHLTKSYDFGDRFISLDTYRPGNFLKMFKMLRYYHPRIRVVFNDVSGVLDSELLLLTKELVHEFKAGRIYYVYNFTNIPNRNVVHGHDKFLALNKDIISQCTESFSRAFNFFHKQKIENALILDLGFGFSKTYEQNWELINRFSCLIKELDSLKISNPLLLGLSKKRFLRVKLNEKDPEKTESLHLKLINNLSQKTSRQLIFRVHDPLLTKNL